MLLWSFTDSLAPHAALLAPYDVSKLTFCPSDRNLVVAGLSSGQVLLWKLDPNDLNVHAKSSGTGTAGDDDEDSKQGPKKLLNVNYRSLSYIDDSHKKPVMDVMWLPPQMIIEKKGKTRAAYPEDGPNRYFATIVS